MKSFVVAEVSAPRYIDEELKSFVDAELSAPRVTHICT